jgi:hypothetical protein
LKKTKTVRLFFILLFLSLLSCKQPRGGEAESPDIFDWRTASWSPFTTADSVKGFAWGRGVYVAAGLHGIIAYSYDGDIWERARKTPDPAGGGPLADPFKLADGGDADFNAAAFGEGVFIAVADGGHLAYSYDGVYWTGKHEVEGFGSENINGIVYGEGPGGAGCFVAVGNGANISAALPSSPGVWAGGNVPGFSAIKDAAFGDGTFYAAGDNGWMGWARFPDPSLPPGSADAWDWHPRQWTFSAQTGTFNPFATKIAFGEYGRGTPGLGISFDEWGGKRLAVCAADRFASGDSAAWDSDIDAGFFGGNRINGIVWSPRNEGTWLAAGESAMIGYWPGSVPGDESDRYWRALSFGEFRWWEITALAVLNGRYFAGGAGGKIGYSR